MKLSRATVLLAYIVSTHAFSDSSPFVLFSTSKILAIPHNGQIQTSSKVVAATQEILSTCPTQRYIFVSQPNIHAADIRDQSSGCNMPNLCRAVNSDMTQGRFSVAEVIGQISATPLVDSVVAACAEKGKVAQIEKVELAHLPDLKETAKRVEILSDNDHELARLLDAFDGDYTVVLFSDPNEFKAYEPEFIEPVHMDLKRQADDGVKFSSRRTNSTSKTPLFEKYQFFTPGIFTGIIALIILLSILTVGLKALASLEVSYGAFDKENGPAAQRKQ